MRPFLAASFALPLAICSGAGFASYRISASPTETRPRLYVLSVGINKYKNAELASCVSDAKSLDELFSKRRAAIFAQATTYLLCDSQATLASVQEKLKLIASEIRPSDVFVFTFSGQGKDLFIDGANRSMMMFYGAFDRGIPTARLCGPPETAPNSDALEHVRNNSLTVDDLQAWSSAISANCQVYLLDTCASGGFTPAFISRVVRAGQDVAQVSLLQKSIALLAASSPGAEAGENDTHGFFTQAVLESIGPEGSFDFNRIGKARTIREIAAYVMRKVPDLSHGLRNQYPQAYFSSGFDLDLFKTGPRAQSVDPERPASISILSPAPQRATSVTVETEMVPVRLQLDGPKIAAVTINAQPAKEGPEGWEAIVALPLGPSTLTVVATSSTGQKTTKHFPFLRKSGTQAQAMKLGKSYALVIGNTNYKNADAWPNLGNPGHDADSVTQILRDQYGFQVQELKDATRKQIKDAILGYWDKKLGPEDQLVFFFAGHGHAVEGKPIGVIAPSDAIAFGTDGGDSCISHADLRRWIAVKGCRHILVILDSCFSGCFDEKIEIGRSLLLNPATWTAPLEPTLCQNDESNLQASFVNMNMEFATFRYLTSGGLDRVNDGPPDGHSPFAQKLIDTLSSPGPIGIVSFSDIKSKLQYLQPFPRAGEFGGDSGTGEFVFVRRKPAQTLPDHSNSPSLQYSSAR